MNKLYIKWWLSVILFTLSSPVFSQKYSIHLAAFTEQIEPTFFSFVGLNDVRYQSTSLNLHQYAWGNFETLAAAEKQLNSYQLNPFLKEFNNLSILASPTNFKVPTTDSSINNSPSMTDFQLFSRSIYVQPSSKSLQKIDVAILEEVTAILKEHPKLKLRIITPENSTSPFKAANSTEVVENFLLAQQIPAYRIKIISPFPTSSQPIEKREGKLKQQVVMTLVDLKEEIVLDKFRNNGLFVRQATNNNHRVLD